MRKQEILKQCIWDEYDMAVLQVFSEMFDTEVKVSFFSDSGRTFTDKMVAALSDFLRLTKSDLHMVKDLLWQDCKESFQSISYGVEVKENETETEANHRQFGISNLNDAYTKSYFSKVTIQEENEFRFRYATLDFNPVWEQEHGTCIIIQNGNLIAKYGNDPYFGWYEEEE